MRNLYIPLSIRELENINRVRNDAVYDAYYDDYMTNNTIYVIAIYCPSCHKKSDYRIDKAYIDSQKQKRQKEIYPFQFCPITRGCKNKPKNFFALPGHGAGVAGSMNQPLVEVIDQIIKGSNMEAKYHSKMHEMETYNERIL